MDKWEHELRARTPLFLSVDDSDVVRLARNTMQYDGLVLRVVGAPSDITPRVRSAGAPLLSHTPPAMATIQSAPKLTAICIPNQARRL